MRRNAAQTPRRIEIQKVSFLATARKAGDRCAEQKSFRRFFHPAMVTGISLDFGSGHHAGKYIFGLTFARDDDVLN
jgi:hypothetical protein